MEELIWTLLVSISGGLMYREMPHSNEECHTEKHLFAWHLWKLLQECIPREDVPYMLSLLLFNRHMGNRNYTLESSVSS